MTLSITISSFPPSRSAILWLHKMKEEISKSKTGSTSSSTKTLRRVTKHLSVNVHTHTLNSSGID